MHRVSQFAVAAVVATSACTGAVVALSSATGTSPLAVLRANPAQTIEALSASSSPKQEAGVPTASAQKPVVRIVQVVDRAGNVSAVAAVPVATPSPQAHATSGASGAGDVAEHEEQDHDREEQDHDHHESSDEGRFGEGDDD